MPTRYRGADRYGNLGYDKVLQSKADAAKRRGLLFDHGSETYECPRCGEIWRNLDDYMAEGGKMHPKKCLLEESDSDEEQISSCDATPIHEKWGDMDSDTSSKLSEFYKEPSILTYTTRTHCVVEKMKSMVAPQCIENIVGVRLHGRTAWFFSKDPTLQYGHHPIYYDTHPWNDELDKYLGGAKYNTALVQVYDGTRDLPYHKDDEPCYDITNNPIRTVNVTGTGDLCISKDKRRLYETIPMASGTVITFPANMQENFYHAVRNPSAGRISITFRNQMRTVERQVAHSANKRWVPIVEARVTTNESRRGDNKQFQEAQSKLQTKTTINFGEFAAEVDGYYPTLSQDHKPALPKIIPELELPTVDFIYVGNMRVPIDFKRDNVPAIVDTARHVAKIIDNQARTSEPIKVFTEQKEVIGNVVTCTGTGFSVADAKEAKALLNGLMYNRASNLFICPSCSDAAVLPEALLTLEHKKSCELASAKKISLARNMQVHVKQEVVARLISQQNSISVPIATLSSCVRGSASTTQVSLHIDEEDSIVDAIHLPNDFITCDHEHAFETDSASDNDVEATKKSEKRRKRRKRNPPPVRQIITRAPVSNIICDVILTCLETQIPVEFIGKSRVTFKPVRVGSVHTVGIQLKHQMYKTGFEVDDLPDRETTSDIILAATRALRRLRHAHGNAQQVHNSDITFGTSGAILPWSWLAHDVIVEGPVQDSLVVRGRNVVSGHVTNALNLQQDCLADDYLQYSEELQPLHDDLSELKPLNVINNELIRQNMHITTLYSNMSKLQNDALATKAEMKLPLFGVAQLVVNQLKYNTTTHEWGERGDYVRKFVGKFFADFPTTQVPKQYMTRTTNGHIRITAYKALSLTSDPEIMMSRRMTQPMLTTAKQADCVFQSTTGATCTSASCTTNSSGVVLSNKCADPAPNTLRVRTMWDDIIIELPLQGGRVHVPLEGLCFSTIFLHMYLLVPDESVKLFHRTVTERAMPSLGQWPTLRHLATWVLNLVAMFPVLSTTPMPEILVHHESQSVHIPDCLGTATSGYHRLNIVTPYDFIIFATEIGRNGCQEYRVGGFAHDIKYTVSLMQDQRKLLHELMLTPTWAFYALSSPTLLKILYRSGALKRTYEHAVMANHNAVDLVHELNFLSERVSRAQTLQDEITAWEANVGRVLQQVDGYLTRNHDPPLQRWYADASTRLQHLKIDVDLLKNGFRSSQREHVEKKEQLLCDSFERLYNEQNSSLESLKTRCGMGSARALIKPSGRCESPEPAKQLSCKDLICSTKDKYALMLYTQADALKRKIVAGSQSAFTTVCAGVAYRATKVMLRTPFNLLNALNTYSLLIAAVNVMVLVQNYRRDQRKRAQYVNNLETQSMIRHYFAHLEQYIVNYVPRDEQFEVIKAKFDEEFPEYNVMFKEVYKERIQFQSADEGKNMCKIFASAILVMMVFDAHRADLMYKSFSQVRALFNTLYDSGNPFNIIFQAERTVTPTMDVIIQEPKPAIPSTSSCTFETWFRNCVNANNVIPVIPECDLLDFTRDTASSVVATLTSSVKREFVIRGFVGSGKSTYLPHLLTKHGKILLCEPVRVLASNVFEALSGSPFYQSPTLLMRGTTKFGSGKITVATSGYAANYYNANRHRLNEFAYIIFDESHQHTAHNFLLRSILDVIGYEGTVLHVSATPIGKEIPFRTMHPVEVVNMSTLSFEDFAIGQRKQVRCDVFNKGANILVYVASYNDVDRMSALLLERGLRVKKIDARTVANVNNITCDGSDGEPLYLVATNIVENGVTLNVDVVVDFGLCVKPVINALQRRVDYVKTPITWGQRIQRNGRVGRYKNGFCLNVGDVYKTPPIISEDVALESALMCFAANVPPIFDNVDPALFGQVTRPQVQTAQMFELPIYITTPMISDAGALQSDIYQVIKKFVLREGSIQLTQDATYLSNMSNWKTIADYFPDISDTHAMRHEKVPFFVKDFGENSYVALAEAIRKARNKSLGARGKLYGDVDATALLLQTDPGSLDRSIMIVETELVAQRSKLEDLNHHVHESTGMFQRYVSHLNHCLRGRYQTDQIQKNIEVLSNMRSTLVGYRQVVDKVEPEEIPHFVQQNPNITMIIDFQSDRTKADGFVKHGINGIYNYTKIASDTFSLLLIACVVIYYVVQYFFREMKNHITFEASGNRRNRLHLRDNKLIKGGYTWAGPSDDMEREFGPEYALKRDKFSEKKARKHMRERIQPRTNMGVKLAPFQVFYGFDVADYDVLQLFDPVTGVKIDMDPRATAKEITEEVEDTPFNKEVWSDTHMPEKIQATFVKKGGVNREDVLKQVRVDMTTHNPTMVTGSGGIMGYPEHKGDFRQTGPPKFSIVPEGRSTIKSGNNIAPFISAMGTIKNVYMNGDFDTLACTQIGNKLVVNAHIFMEPVKKQELILQHGVYELPNNGTINIKHVPGIDMVIQTLPMDVPLARQIKAYRGPIPGELIRLLKIERNTKTNSTSLSDPGTARVGPGTIWYHNITTKHGDCGSLVLSEKDNKIVGIHTGQQDGTNLNLFAPITKDAIIAIETVLPGELNDWVFTPDMLDVGSNNAIRKQASDPFPVVKKLLEGITFQNNRTTTTESVSNTAILPTRKYWVASDLPVNIKYQCDMPTFFNTRHTYEGESQPFMAYLRECGDAETFFRPLLSHYIPSNLNGDAFKKDFFKYGKPVPVGLVHGPSFKIASDRVIKRFERVGYERHSIPFEFDAEVIRDDLNKHAAMGAQYVGKKEQHLDGISEEQFCDEFVASCCRLANNCDGVWKGSLKAELRSKEKVQENKTRVFTSAPYDVLLGGKACVMHFNKKFYANNTKGPWTVGINKLGLGWHRLLKSLPEGFIYGTGDGSQFDSSLTPLLINEVCRIRMYFMQDDELGQAMLRGLYRQIIWTLISMPDGSVVRKAKGNPSGQPSTVDDNTIMVMLAVEYVFAYLGITQEEMDTIFKYYANGDDLIFAIHPDRENILNEFTHLFAHLGLNYIFEDRTRNRAELEYMSLTGIEREGLYIPKLSRERISSIVQWRRKGDTRAMFDALNAAILESWGYDDLTYWLRKYYEWLIMNRYDIDLPEGEKLPYHTETAVETLYTCDDNTTVYDGRYDFEVPTDASGGVFIIDFQSSSGTDTPPVNPPVTSEPAPQPALTRQTSRPPTPPNPIMTGQQQQQLMPKSSQPHQVEPLLTPVGVQQPTFGTFGMPQAQQTTTDPVVAAARVRGKQKEGDTSLSQVRDHRRLSPERIVRHDDDLAPPNESTSGESSHYDELTLPDVPRDKRKGLGARLKGKPIITQTQIYNYRPAFGSIHNNKATDIELEAWKKQISDYFQIEDVSTLILGFMAYVIENGTSPEIFTNQKFVMATSGGEQREYPLAPFRSRSVELRKIMRRFSEEAIDYIQIQREHNPQYVPRQAVVRNVKRAIYFPYCFDFIDETILTPDALEIVHQMKAAALESASSKVLGLDGGSARAIDTERHTTEDATARTHNLRGAAMMA